MILGIRVFGDPVLRQVTTPVREITPELLALADNMIETMHAAQGIGLAAPQVGRTERLAVVDVDDEKFVLFNPEILTTSSSAAKAEEGCLSIPEVMGDVERPERVRIRALDREGNPFEVEAGDLLGRCLQHEIDHLHGRLFIDYLGYFKKKSALAKWEKEKAKYPGFIRTLTADEIAAMKRNGGETL